MIHARLRYGQRPSAKAMNGVSFRSDRTGENTSRTVAPSGPDESNCSLSWRCSATCVIDSNSRIQLEILSPCKRRTTTPFQI